MVYYYSVEARRDGYEEVKVTEIKRVGKKNPHLENLLKQAARTSLEGGKGSYIALNAEAIE